MDRVGQLFDQGLAAARSDGIVMLSAASMRVASFGLLASLMQPSIAPPEPKTRAIGPK